MVIDSGDGGHPGFQYPHPNPQSAARHPQGRFPDDEDDDRSRRNPTGAFKTASQQLVSIPQLGVT